MVNRKLPVLNNSIEMLISTDLGLSANGFKFTATQVTSMPTDDVWPTMKMRFLYEIADRYGKLIYESKHGNLDEYEESTVMCEGDINFESIPFPVVCTMWGWVKELNGTMQTEPFFTVLSSQTELTTYVKRSVDRFREHLVSAGDALMTRLRVKNVGRKPLENNIHTWSITMNITLVTSIGQARHGLPIFKL